MKTEKKKGKKTTSVAYSFDSIVGKSNELKQAITLAQKVSRTDAAVLLTGETGTGKEVFAHAIHQASQRASQPIVDITVLLLVKTCWKVNCLAIRLVHLQVH